MAVTANGFRGHFSEFGDLLVFPDAQIEFYLGIAPNLVNSERWGSSFDLGVELFIAHNITLDARAVRDAKTGQLPGAVTGPVSGRSVDKVSVSYDTSAAAERDQGHWNLTVYGLRYIRLGRMFGAGPLQVGTGGVSSSAYSGPWVYNFPNPS